MSIYLGESKETSSGDEVRYNCPFCEQDGRSPDTDYKLYVNETKGFFFCQRCNKRGTTEWLFRQSWTESRGPKLSNFEESWSKFYSLQPKEDYKCPIPPLKERLGSEAQDYLLKRGINHEMMDFYNIKEGTSFLSGRVVFQEFLGDRLITWVARTFWDAEMRYFNAPGPTRANAVFNLERAVLDSVIITEGVFDAIAAGRNAVATYGKFCTGIQFDRIIGKKFREYTVVYDSDAFAETLELCKRLRAYSGAAIYYLRLSKGEDPSSLGYSNFQMLLLSDRKSYDDSSSIMEEMLR